MVKMLRAPAVPPRGPSYNELRDALRRLVNAGTAKLYEYEPHKRGHNEWRSALRQGQEMVKLWEEVDR